MSNIAIPNTFEPYFVAASADMNANFAEIENKFNTYAVQTDVAATIAVAHTFSVAPVFGFATANQALELDAFKGVQSVAITGTGNYVKSASPTFTGTMVVAAATVSGALTLTGGEASLVHSGVRYGGLAQVSGANTGFDIFTPVDERTYYIVVAGQDTPAGVATNAFVDVLVVKRSTAVVTVVLSSSTAKGSPGARTYSNNAGALRVALAGAALTYYLDVALTRFSS